MLEFTRKWKIRTKYLITRRIKIETKRTMWAIIHINLVGTKPLSIDLNPIAPNVK
jgi:hypothetical protein